RQENPRLVATGLAALQVTPSLWCPALARRVEGVRAGTVAAIIPALDARLTMQPALRSCAVAAGIIPVRRRVEVQAVELERLCAILGLRSKRHGQQCSNTGYEYEGLHPATPFQ